MRYQGKVVLTCSYSGGGGGGGADGLLVDCRFIE
jgi:hypothetical protein